MTPLIITGVAQDVKARHQNTLPIAIQCGSTQEFHGYHVQVTESGKIWTRVATVWPYRNDQSGFTLDGSPIRDSTQHSAHKGDRDARTLNADMR
jgi:hypothetical protein